VQVEWKWCDGLSRDNLKNKLYRARNLWEEAPLPSPSILYAFPRGLYPNVTFPQDSQVGVLKLRLLLSQNFGRSCLFQIKSILRLQGQYLIEIKNICPTMYNMFHKPHLTPAFKGFVVGSQILNLTLTPSFDHNSCKSGLNDQ
jgi:hypothetical protein